MPTSESMGYRTFIHASLLFLAVIVSQFSNIIYEKLNLGEDISTVIIPSLLFLSFLTVPCILIGFRLGKSIGLSINQPHSSYNIDTGYSPVFFAVISGISLGLLLLMVRYFSLPYLPDEIPQYGFRGVMGGLFVSIGAAIGEEVWFRFGLMTLLLWLSKRLLKLSELNLTTVWVVMFTVAFSFGAAHLPQLIAYGAGTNFAIWGTMLGNIAVSFLYGWCFWRYGLISAIIAHFSLDVILHVLPALIKFY